MNSFSLSIWSLIGAMLAQSIVSGLAIEGYLDRKLEIRRQRAWLAIAIGSTLLALHHGYTLSLAAQTGLYDFRQAILAMLAAALMAYAIVQLRRS